MKKKYAKAYEIKDKFSFLHEYDFVLSREETLNYGAYVEFKGNGIKIYLGFDYKKYFFNFLIFKGENLEYSDINFGKEIISFCDLARKYDNDFNCSNLQPNKNEYKQALDANVMLLKKYGNNILKGKE